MIIIIRLVILQDFTGLMYTFFIHSRWPSVNIVMNDAFVFPLQSEESANGIYFLLCAVKSNCGQVISNLHTNVL